jgi:hypothetical protein
MTRDLLAPVATVVGVLVCCGVWSLVGGAAVGWTIEEILGIGIGGIAIALVCVLALMSIGQSRRRA